MRIGLHALGIGSGADPEVVAAVARSADAAGFSTLWSGEHIVMVDRPDAPYPYAPDGRIAVPSDADWLDPFVTLSFAAAVTSRIRLATGVLLLPEHHPLLVAKQAASLDALQGSIRPGRRHRLVVRGVRGARDPVSGASPSHPGVRRRDAHGVERQHSLVPRRIRPVRRGQQLSKASWWCRHSRGHGREQRRGTDPCRRVRRRLVRLQPRGRRGRGADRHALAHAVDNGIGTWRRSTVAVSTRDGTPQDLEELAHWGVDELVVVDSPPDEPEAAADWVTELTATWRPG